jgi:DNA polymerase-3 subunit beta
MKLVISQKQFAEVLNEVKSAIPSKPTHPILANVRLDANNEDQILTVTTFDLNLAIRVDVPAQIIIEGSITVSHKLLSEIVTRLPDEDVTFSLNDNGKIDLKCGNGKYQLHGLPVDKFPELPKALP